MASSLHPDVLALVKMKPIEDLTIDLLRPRLTGVKVQTLIEDDQQFPAVLVRANGDWGNWGGDPRFLDSAQLNLQVYCEGVNADEDAALLSEAIRVVLNDSVNVKVPGLGHFTRVKMVQRPRNVSDWASATGPVQYADLPTGVFRYETLYDVTVKRDVSQ